MHIPPEDLQYVTSLEEIIWGGILVAITLAMHGFGMVWTIQTSGRLKRWFAGRQSFAQGMGIIILASWMIILVHLIEVLVWAGFFLWKGAMPSSSLAYYFALMDYTTLGSNFNLPLRWRLLAGMIAIAGLMTFAWSTGVLLTLAQEFQDQQLRLARRREEHPARLAPSSTRSPADTEHH
jgi:hypothetical protein